MTLDRRLVEHIAELARLSLTEDEITLYAEQLADILAYVEQLQEVDTSAVPPTASVLPLASVMREDAVRPSLAPDEALANAPDSTAQQFRVPAVLDDSP